MSVWWVGRRDALLADVAGTLVFFGADPLDDPGIGELADTARILAAECRASTRGPNIRQAGTLLEQAAAELYCADRFRGALLPVVVRHLRCAASTLVRAGALRRAPAAPDTTEADTRGAGQAAPFRTTAARLPPQQLPASSSNRRILPAMPGSCLPPLMAIPENNGHPELAC